MPYRSRAARRRAAWAVTIPSNVLTFRGEPLTLNGEYLTLGPAVYGATQVNGDAHGST